jgi:hypothetical protein
MDKGGGFTTNNLGVLGGPDQEGLFAAARSKHQVCLITSKVSLITVHFLMSC